MVRPGPQVYVQTRGTARAADYAFLCGAPPHTWWRAYRDATAFDHPTVLVVSDGGGWAAYLSGIPSARVDAVGEGALQFIEGGRADEIGERAETLGLQGADIHREPGESLREGRAVG